MATNTLHIRVRSDGTRVVGKNISRIGEKANIASRQIFIMRRAVQTLFAALGVRAGFRAVEQFTELNNKIKTVTSSTKELVAVRKKLLAISNESRTSLSATVQLYARTTRAVKKLGLSEAKRLRFTSLLTKEAIVGGATTIEATNAIRQLTQGMGAAGLKGEELRSVLEQLPTVGQRIADFLGVTQGELRKLGEEGQLTGEVVVAAMLAAEDSIEKAFGETTSTVGQAFEVFKNNFVEFAGTLDQVVGLSAGLAKALKLIGENLRLIVSLMAAVAAIKVFNILSNNAGRFGLILFQLTTRLGQFLKALLSIRAASVVAFSASTLSTMSKLATTLKASAVAGNAGLLARAIGLMLGPVGAVVAGVATLATGLFFLTRKTEDLKVATDETTKSLEEMTAALIAADRAKSGTTSPTVADAVQPERITMGLGLDQMKEVDEVLTGVLPEAQRKIVAFRNEAQRLAEIRIREGFSGVKKESEAFKVATKEVKRLRDELGNIQIESTKLNSLEDVLKNAAIGARKFGQELKFADRVSQGLLGLFTQGNRGILSDEEEAGGAANKAKQEQQGYIQRLAQIEDLWQSGLLFKSRYDNAKAFIDEKLGGGQVRLDKLREEVALLKQFGGDQELVDLKLAGVDDEILKKIAAQKQKRVEILDTIRASARAEQDAARAAAESTRNTEAKLQALREQIRLFGLSEKQRERADFLSTDPTLSQRVQFEGLTNRRNQQEISAGVQEQIDKLKQTTTAFAEQAKLLEEVAKTAGPQKLEQIDRILVEGKDALTKQAKDTAEAIAADLGTAGDKSIEEVRAALVAGAGTIGTQAGSALVTAFKAAVLGAIPGLNALAPPGVSGVSTPEQDAERETRSAQIDESANAAIRATEAARALNEEFRLFGPTVENSTSRGSAALKGFGDEAITFGGELKNAFSSIFGSLEDALVGFVTTGKLDFKSLINSILADLARMVVRMLIIKPLMGFFGGFFGGIFGFSGGGAVNSAFGLPGLAGGGFVNDDPATPARFATGGRVHGPGTGVSDSVNALLSRDEFVVNAAASRPNMAGLEYLNSTGRMPGGGSVTSVSYSPNVMVTVEGNSDNAASNGAQIAKDMEQQMRAQFNEFVQQEQKPGGAFSKTNEDVL